MGKCKKLHTCSKLVPVDIYVDACLGRSIFGTFHIKGVDQCAGYSHSIPVERLKVPRDWIIKEDPCDKCEIGCSPYDLRHNPDPNADFRCETKIAFDKRRESMLRYRLLWKLQAVHKRLRDTFRVLRGKAVVF
jgi:hypothetical protein